MTGPIGNMRQFCCDSCGRMYHEFEFVETIEEMLCERCASGIDSDDFDEDFDDGIENGFDEED